MKLKFYGTRGSIPTPSTRDFKTDLYGGNTTCMEITSEKGVKHIVDAGTGIRVLGMDYAKNPPVNQDINLYFTHLHWDHIQGLPFFGAAFNPKNNIRLYSDVKTDRKNFMKVLQEQQNSRNFPVPLKAMAAIKDHYAIIPGTGLDHDDVSVQTCKLNHPGSAIAYRFDENGKSLVIATDFEPDEKGRADELYELIKGADFWIADGQYEIESKDNPFATSKNPFMKGWGHSDPFWDAKTAIAAGVRNLIITHHEPKMEDAYHSGLEKRLKEFTMYELRRQEKPADALNVYLAKEGDVYDIDRQKDRDKSIDECLNSMVKA